MTLGEKIKYYREIQKIGQEHLAALSHISVSAIRKYESGERIPKESQIEKIAYALHISPISLQDIHFDSFLELLPYLYEISKQGGIYFTGDKGSDGKYTEESLSIRFTDPEYMSFFKDWADKKDECDKIRSAADELSDPTTKELMLGRVRDIENEIESTLVSGRIIDNIYSESEIPANYPSKRIKETTPPLKEYSDFVDVLNTLARTSIKFECYGIFERIWEPQAIFTFEAESLDKEKLSSYAEDAYAKFLFYFDEIKKYKVPTEAFAFQHGLTQYYRYIIKDRVLATALGTIQKIAEADFESFNDEERNAFETEIEHELSKYDIPINYGGK